jgi:heme-degrading monooxygenase HmoA
MSVIKINAITVATDSGDELALRFAARAGAVDDQDGFEGFELLKPADERTTWLVVTRWRDEEAFQAWVSSPASKRHTGAPRRTGGRSRTSEQPASCGPTPSPVDRPGVRPARA